jgi:hypothetical protein
MLVTEVTDMKVKSFKINLSAKFVYMYVSSEH